MLSRAGLPQNYYGLSDSEKQRARMDVLTSWFDADRPEVLCTNVERLIQAHFLFVEFYLKPCEYNASLYYWRDPIHKYDMVRSMMAPPKVSTEPSKAVVHAP